jgi:hypothetical protein
VVFVVTTAGLAEAGTSTVGGASAKADAEMKTAASVTAFTPRTPAQNPQNKRNILGSRSKINLKNQPLIYAVGTWYAGGGQKCQWKNMRGSCKTPSGVFAREKSEYSLPRGFAAKKRGGNWK